MSGSDVIKKLQKVGSYNLQAVKEAREFCHLSNDLNVIFDKLKASYHLVIIYAMVNGITVLILQSSYRCKGVWANESIVTVSV